MLQNGGSDEGLAKGLKGRDELCGQYIWVGGPRGERGWRGREGMPVRLRGADGNVLGSEAHESENVCS